MILVFRKPVLALTQEGVSAVEIKMPPPLVPEQRVVPWQSNDLIQGFASPELKEAHVCPSSVL